MSRETLRLLLDIGEGILLALLGTTSVFVTVGMFRTWYSMHRIRTLVCKFMERKPYQPVLASTLQDYLTQQGVRFTSPQFYQAMASLEDDEVIVSRWVEHEEHQGLKHREKSYVHKEWL